MTLPAKKRKGATVVPALPTAPGGKWLGQTKAVWKTFWESPVIDPRVVSPETDMIVLHHWITYVDEWFRTMKIVRKGRLVKGSMGQAVLNPLIRYAMQLEDKILKVAERFGLDPLSRMRLGIAFGEAQRSLADLNAEMEEDEEGEEYEMPEGFEVKK